ncbi:ATP-dependent DNA ligase [Streptomyces sp. NPDC096046]|uniref:ATP-dependent DNA ligase n=1 Tax=Streptomyces sp. NPDC096046 TaxID=3155542 RepID=UPI00332C267B
MWERDRLAFERLQQRLARRGAVAAQAAREWPAHFVAFNLVHRGDDLTGWPYARRHAALEALFAELGLTAPFTLCPSTTDPALAREWLSWTAAGVEGLCFKRLEESYRGGVAAAGPLRPGGPPAVHRPQHHSLPGRRPRCGRPAGPAAQRASVDRLDVLGRVGNAAHPRCRPGAA